MIEKHGALWDDGAGWEIAYERYDPGTNLLALVVRHPGLACLRAEVLMPEVMGFDIHDGQAVWQNSHICETIFNTDRLDEAIAYVEKRLAEECHRFRTDPPAAR
jgi:hypothetical protein